jgi:hypothetical protein
MPGLDPARLARVACITFRMRLWLAPVWLVACGGSTSQVSIGPPPPPTTSGVYAGPLCAGDHCSCHDDSHGGDGGAGVPLDADHKRFEIRLKSPQALWATVGQAHMYKSVERAEACFYVDLPAGDTAVELRASDHNGAAGAWEIHELGTKTKSYYDTFSFNCGVPGVCSFDELDANKAQYQQLAKQLRDTCGSTKVKGLSWDTGHAPDQAHPDDLLVRLHLDVYKFAPWKEHGDPSCGHGKPPGDGSGSDASDAPSDEASPQ